MDLERRDAARVREILDHDQTDLARGFEPDVGILGDARTTMDALSTRLGPRTPDPAPVRDLLTRTRQRLRFDHAGGPASAFLDQVDVDPANVHPMPSTESADSAEAGAAAYADELRAHGSGTFEVVILGLGPDAHVASLFPGFPQVDSDDIAVAVHDSPKPPPDRISLTLPCLNRARSVWFVVSGEEKADAVALALADGTDVHDAPAAGVSGELETIWFLDRAAASKL